MVLDNQDGALEGIGLILALQSCQHENTQWEYVSCNHYVETYKCLRCEKEVERYIECQ